jgi:L-alanine-DL-glutamate epimerase-like enolase superfamily enzyme
MAARSVSLQLQMEQWPRRFPARITGYSWDTTRVLQLSITSDGATGRSEASGVYFRGEDVSSVQAQLEQLRPKIEAGIDRQMLHDLLPPGGARNALDCALWDLEAKLTGRPAWQIAGLATRPSPLLTTYTCHAASPEEMASQAKNYLGAKAIKLKLTGEDIDAERVAAVRETLPEVWLSVDANQGFTRPLLERFMPLFVKCRVAMIEQPFPIGQDALLDDFESPIPIAADESVRCLSDIPSMVDRYNVINIKLDKCGGLTEGLAMARDAKARGLKVMVGNMGGTSLAMAPAFLIGQQCDVVDLDGPIFLKSDREPSALYTNGMIYCPESVWGAP